MRNMNMVILTLLVSLLCISMISVPSEAETPTIDFILAAMRQQNTATVQVRFSIEYIGFPNPTDGLAEPPPTALDGTNKRGKLATFSGTATPTPTYIRTPEILYLKDDLLERSSERIGIDQVGELRLKETREDKCYGLIESKGVYRWNNRDRMESVMYPTPPRRDDPHTNFLYGWIGYGNISDQMEKIDGIDCWKIDITNTGDSIAKHIKVWLDPVIGFNPRRMVMSGSDKNGSWTITIESTDYKQISDGIWFPQKQTVIRDVPAMGDNNARIVYRALELHGDRMFSKGDLTVSFPSGTQVRLQLPDGSYKTIVQP